MEKGVSVTKEFQSGSLSSMCGGKVNLKKTRDFQRGSHVMAISLTISLDYLPQI